MSHLTTTARKALYYGIVFILAMMMATIYMNHHIGIQSSTRQGGDRGGGVGCDVMKTLPLFVYSTRTRPRIGRGAKVCGYCWKEFKDSEMVRWLPNCDHIFHIGCINEWLCFNQTWPSCLAVVHHGFPDSMSDHVVHFPSEMR